MTYQEYLYEIRSLEMDELAEKRKIDVLDKDVESAEHLIEMKLLSISIEDVLLTLPTKALGSNCYSKSLNEQSNLYEADQFNKIVRFLTLIEAIENDYNSFQKKVRKSYYLRPSKNDAETLVSRYNLLKDEYQLMDVLIDAVISDSVLFNKVYNMLEDRGVFMPAYDKMNFENLSSIASNMVQIVEQNAISTENLSNINRELWETNSRLEYSNEFLVSIDAGVKASNILSAIQNYQMYRTRKILKG